MATPTSVTSNSAILPIASSAASEVSANDNGVDVSASSASSATAEVSGVVQLESVSAASEVSAIVPLDTVPAAAVVSAVARNRRGRPASSLVPRATIHETIFEYPDEMICVASTTWRAFFIVKHLTWAKSPEPPPPPPEI